MEICYSPRAAWPDYLEAHQRRRPARTIFLDRFLENAIEIDVDALCDGEDVADRRDHAARRGGRRPLGRLGLRDPGDVARARHARARSSEATEAIALRARASIGLINIQFAVYGDEELYVIEANPRASRTVPFVSKAIGVPLAKVACRLMLGERLARHGARHPGASRGHVSVKEAVLPFGRFPRADALLGPEMKSTGEVMGVAADYPTAFGKAQAAAGAELPGVGHGLHLASPTATSRPPPSSPPRFHDLGFRVRRHRRDRAGDPAHGRAGRADQEALRGLAERGRPDRGRRGRPRDQHADGSGARADGYEIRRAGDRARHPLHHDDVGRQRGAARDPRQPQRARPRSISLQELHGGSARAAASCARSEPRSSG